MHSYDVPAAPVSSRMHEHTCAGHKSRAVADKPLFGPGKAAHTRSALEGGLWQAQLSDRVIENDYTHPSLPPEEKRKTDCATYFHKRRNQEKRESLTHFPALRTS